MTSDYLLSIVKSVVTNTVQSIYGTEPVLWCNDLMYSNAKIFHI